MSKASIKKNYIYNAFYQIFLIFVPLITTPFLSRALHADGIGIVSFAESIVAYFLLFANLGVQLYGQREISYVQNDVKKRSNVFFNIFVFKLIVSIIVLIIYLIFSLLYLKSIIYIIFSIQIIAVIFDITWFFQGMEEFRKIVTVNFIFKLINVLLVINCIHSSDDITLYVLFISLMSLLPNLFLWLYVKNYIVKVPLNKIKPFKDFSIIFSLLIPTIAIHIYTVVDKTLIGVITKNAFENGYYEQAIKISKLVLTIITSLGIVVVPRIGKYFVEKNDKMIQSTMYKSYRFVWFLGLPICFGLIMVSDNFVPWFFGAGFDKVALLLKILPFLVIAIGMSNVTGIQYLIPTGKQNVFTYTVLLGASVNFILNIILIRYFYSVGASIASIIAEFSVTLSQLYFIKKNISLKNILKDGKNYYISVFFMSLVLYLIKDKFSPSIIHTFILVVIGVTIYFSVLIILRDEFLFDNFIDVYYKTKNKIKSKIKG